MKDLSSIKEISLEDHLHSLGEKYQGSGQSLSCYLEGLFHAKELTYWDYIRLDSLLSLQDPLTHFPDEISHKLGQMPTTVAAPIGNGTVIAGIHQGFLSLGENAFPRMIAGSIARQNPVLVSFESGHSRCEDLSPESLDETHTNMPLINWHALDGEEALQSLYHSRGLAQGLSDQEMVDLSDLLYRQEGISALPAATAGLGALICAHLQGNIAQGPHVAVLTARNM